MVLHDYNEANQTPASYRTDVNNLNLAIASNNASSSGITNTFAGMWYEDVSSSGWMRQRNTADSTFNYIFKTDAPGGLCTYAGNPSTNHIGLFLGQLCLDTTNKVFYYNTLTGTSSAATWSMIASSSAFNTGSFPKGYMAGPPVTYNSATQVIIPSGFKCRDSGNAADISFSSAFTIDITVSGAGGLSTDLTEASSQWYYLFAMRKSADGTINGILTTATSAPTLPSGYDQYRMIPFPVRNSSVGDFRDMYASHGWPYTPLIVYDDNIGTGSSVGVNNVLSAGHSTTFADVDCSAFMPPAISGTAHLKLMAVYGSGSGIMSVRKKGDSHNGYQIEVGTNYQGVFANTLMLVSSSGAVQYQGSVASLNSYLWVDGFVVDKLS